MAGQSIWLAACVALVSSLACHAAPPIDHAQSVARHGETRVVAHLNGVNVSADLLTHEVLIGTASDQPPKRKTLNCTYSHVPCLLVDSLEISVGGRQVVVPRSAFGDMADVWTAKLHPMARGRFGLTLEGGDASESYEAEIVFDRSRVRERTITDREAQMMAEKTVYYDRSRAFR
jgi:hypothetical protein